MRVWVCYDSAHTHLRRPLEQTVCHRAVGLRDACQSSGDSQYTIMYTRYDLADPSAHARLVPKVRNILSGFTNDHTGFFGCDDSTQSDLRCGILLFCPWLLVCVEAAQLIGDVIDARVDRWREFFSRHG